MAAIQTASKIDNDGNDNFPAVHYAVGHYVSRRYAAAVYGFPATIAFKAMTNFQAWHLLVLFGIFALLCGVIAVLLKVKAKR